MAEPPLSRRTRDRWRGEPSLPSELLLYLGSLLLMLGLGTLYFDPRHNSSPNTAAGIAVTILGGVALVACLALWNRDA
jgi:hypothetical protein